MTDDAALGILRDICQILEAFGIQKMKTIKMFSVLFGIIALFWSVLAGIGIYDARNGFHDPVTLLASLAGVFWGLFFLVLIGGLSSRAAGAHSEIRIHEHGFVLVQGKRFGGAKIDTCLWRDVVHARERFLLGTFLGYGVETASGAKIFLSMNFDDLVGKVGPHLRKKF